MEHQQEDQGSSQIFIKEEAPSEEFESGRNKVKADWCEIDMEIKSETEEHYKYSKDLNPIPLKKTKNKQLEEKIFMFCDLCEFKTKLTCNFKKHKRTVHEKVKNMCPYCNKEFLYLKEHVDTIHLKKNFFECKECDFTTVRKGTIRRHMQTHETLRIKETCPICFVELFNIKQHIKKVHAEPILIKDDYQCPNCPYKGTKVNLNSHVLNVHEVSFTKCTVCNKDVNIRKLNSHMKKHEANPFSCNPCNKTFRVSRDLVRHVLYYHKNHRNTCEYCGKDVTSLKQHVK